MRDNHSDVYDVEFIFTERKGMELNRLENVKVVNVSTVPLIVRRGQMDLVNGSNSSCRGTIRTPLRFHCGRRSCTKRVETRISDDYFTRRAPTTRLSFSMENHLRESSILQRRDTNITIKEDLDNATRGNPLNNSMVNYKNNLSPRYSNSH